MMIDEVTVVLNSRWTEDFSLATDEEIHQEILRVFNKYLPAFIKSGNWKVRYD